MEINIKTEIEKLLRATNTNNVVDIAKQKQIINAFFRIIQIDAIEGTNTENKGYDVILIDDYMFKTLSWKNTNYLVAAIKSINIKTYQLTYFTVYASKSELGLWRLLSKKNGEFYKGADYVQQTMIDINLQIFINKSINIITETRTDIFVYIDNRLILYSSDDLSDLSSLQVVMLDDEKLTKITNGHIDDETRKIKIEPFAENDRLPEHRCDFKNDRIPLDNINARLLMLSQLIEGSNGFRNIQKITKINDFTSKYNIDQHSALSIYSLLFENNYILYYFTFKRGKGEKYFSPIILSRSDSKVTNYGTYSYYVPAGYYICKPYDGNPSIGEKNISVNVGRHKYYLIADRYTNLYPYTKHNTIGHTCGSCTLLNVPGASNCGACGADI